MQKFISCDWGTSTLRLRVIDINNRNVITEITRPMGISGTFEIWKKSGKPESERKSFYQSVLAEDILKLEENMNLSLAGVSLIISGMASANIGMMPLPYKEAPFGIDGSDLYTEILEATDDFKHKVLLISGATTGNDVMRGEETQLIGCLSDNDREEKLLVFPGTHSKHVKVMDGKVVDFKTYMTGEFFELLSKKSILSNDVEETRELLSAHNIKRFEEGVADSLSSNLLHSSFFVRTNHLFNKLTKQENYCYLSGLLIGTELKDLTTISMPMIIVSDDPMKRFYRTALLQLGIPGAEYQELSVAVIKGHCKIYDLYKSELPA